MRADQRKHHVIYKTTCLPTGKWYIGMHSTDDLNDGYLGSGTFLWRSIKKYGKAQHKYEILEHLPSRKALICREEEFITVELRNDSLCMNLRSGGTGNHGRIPTADTRRKTSETLRKTYAIPEIRERKKTAHNSPEAKANNSAAQKIAQNRPEVQARRSVTHSKRCTIDGVVIYPSLKALVAEHGQGKNGRYHPDFRYI